MFFVALDNFFSRTMYSSVFHIPPDFDDTSVNLGLGSLLKDLITEFPQSSVYWQSVNSNLSSVFHALKHYAYRPTSNDSRVNSIDTRTYYYMRRFLENATAENKTVSLVTTWVSIDYDTVTVCVKIIGLCSMYFNLNRRNAKCIYSK